MKIEVTYNCLLSCVHCSSDANPDNQLSISKENCIKIIDDAILLGLKKIAFSGGEPLIWDGIIDIIDYSKKRKLQCSIYTSGNFANLEKKIIEVKNVGIDKLIFSLYSDDANEHDRITRKLNSYKNTIKAIKLAQHYKINTELHFVALASNYKKLIGIVEIAKKNNIKKISVLRFVPQGRGSLLKFDILSRKQNLELIKIIKNIKNNYDIRTGSPFNVLLLNDEPKCMAARDRLIIAPDLNIYPCDAFKQISSNDIAPNDNYSNLRKHNLIECWQKSKYFENVRNALISQPSEPCYSCKNYIRCLGGCLAQKFIYY